MGGHWKRGDVIGCLLDLTTDTMMITLNGELLLNSHGSEFAGKDFIKSDGELSVIGSISFQPTIYRRIFLLCTVHMFHCLLFEF